HSPNSAGEPPMGSKMPLWSEYGLQGCFVQHSVGPHEDLIPIGLGEFGVDPVGQGAEFVDELAAQHLGTCTGPSQPLKRSHIAHCTLRFETPDLFADRSLQILGGSHLRPRPRGTSTSTCWRRLSRGGA